MGKNARTLEQKKLDIDLWIIVISSLLVLGVYIGFQDQIMPVVRDDGVNILLRVLIAASLQFGLAGLGISIVCLMRKESFLSYGLRAKGAVAAIGFSALCFAPHIIFLAATGQLSGYLPFQKVGTTSDVLASGFPVNALGLLLTAIAWGFFEGFNYAVISEKINKRYPSKNRWLNWGAISCAILCVLIHGAIGVTPEGIVEMCTILIIIYGIIMVKEITQNAWGCVFVFMFLWNAL